MTASGYRDFSGVDENIVELDGGDGCRLCEYPKNDGIVYFKGISFIVCESHLNFKRRRGSFWCLNFSFATC